MPASQGEPQLQQRLLIEEYAYAVLQRLLHCAVELGNCLARVRGRHSPQQVHDTAVRRAQAEQHMHYLGVV